MSESTARPLPAESLEDAARVTAFETFAEQQIYESYKLAMAILASPQDAQDAVHDAFVKAWGRWPSLRDHTKFEAWFRRILVNTCRDRLRAAKHRRSADIADHGHVPAPDVLRSVDERVHVERALTQLEPDDQVLFVLRYYMDLELADISELLEIPTGTVKSRLNAAHSRLGSIVERFERNT